MTPPNTVSLRRLSQLPSALQSEQSEQISAARQFPMRIPQGFAELIDWNDPLDPLLLQVLPDPRELSGSGSTDPVGELASRQAGGLVHKYSGRALLVTTSACDIHCRYCFRRHYPYEDAAPDHQRWVEAVNYLQDQPEVSELILSGGDPLTLSNRRLARLGDELKRLPQLRRLRIHTRTPLVKPQRVDEELLSWIAQSSWPVTLVLHCNHQNEISDAAQKAIGQLRRAGATLLNQSVLLAGVNDRLAVLKSLSEALFDAGVLPYYLHQLDPVQGADHFAVSEQRAIELIDALREQLPGYLVPRLVWDPAGSAAKQIIA